MEMVVKEEVVVVAKGKLLKSRLPRRSEKRKALDAKSAGHSTAIRAERVPTFSNPWGLLAITSTSGTGPKTLFIAERGRPGSGAFHAPYAEPFPG